MRIKLAYGEHGIEIDVRVTHRVLIAERAVDARRYVEQSPFMRGTGTSVRLAS